PTRPTAPPTLSLHDALPISLAVALDRRALPEARDAVVRDLHLDHLCRVLRLARDHERLRKVERRDAGRDVHRGYTRRPRACSSGDRKSTRLNSSHDQISYAV